MCGVPEPFIVVCYYKKCAFITERCILVTMTIWNYLLRLKQWGTKHCMLIIMYAHISGNKQMETEANEYGNRKLYRNETRADIGSTVNE